MADHTLHQLSEHVYWLTPESATDRPVLGVVAGTRASLIVDAGNSPAHAQALLHEIARHQLPKPAYLALTHWHWDHVFGAATLALPTIASHETARVIAKMTQLDWGDAALDQRVAEGIEIAFCRDMIKAELPDRSALTLRSVDIAFATEITVDLGGVTCQLAHIGGDHAPDASIVVIPQDSVVFLGDCAYEDIYHGPRRLTPTHLFPLLDRLLAYDATYYLGGHDTAPTPRTQFQEEAALLTTIGRAVEQHGPQRDPVLAALAGLFGEPLNEDQISIADAFLAGQHMPEVASVL